MKRYDELIGLKNTDTNIVYEIWRFYRGDIEKRISNNYKILVRCRKCGNKHFSDVNCQLCGINTKINLDEIEEG